MDLPILPFVRAAARLALALGLLAAVPLARGDDYRWEGTNGTGGPGDFNTFGWYDFTTGKDHVGPPTASDNAYLVDNSVVTCTVAGINEFFTSPNGGVLDLSGTFTAAKIGSLNLTGTGTFTANDFGSVTIAGVTDTGTTINVTGATLYAPLYYGPTAPTVNLGGGGAIGLSYSGTGMPHGTPTLGTVHVYDPGSVLTAFGVQGFNGRIDTGARLQTDDLTTVPGSTLELDGPGTTWSDSDNPTISGGLRITNGAAATTTSDERTGNLTVTGATQPGPGGIALVSGAGSSLQSNVSIGAGTNGGSGGSMTIDGGGTFQGGNIGVAGGDAPGTLNVIHGSVVNGSINDDGVVAVSGGSQVLGGLTAGYSMPGATATFDGPGTLLTGGADVGFYAGGVGDVSFTHSAVAQFGSADSPYINTYLTIGEGGTGTLTFDSAAALQMPGIYNTLEMGDKAGSLGTLNIKAAGTMSLAGPLLVGNMGEGILNAEGHAVALSNLTLGSIGAGEINVSGSGAFMVGNDFTNFIDFGVGQDATGQASVSGPAATASFNSPMTLGVAGHGGLTVSGGGTAHIVSALLGENINAVGTLEVYNSGSSLAVARDLTVGGPRGITTLGGYGMVGVNDDALLTIHREFFLSATGAATVAPAPLPDGSTPASGGRIYVGIDNTGPDGAVRVGKGGLLVGKGTELGTTIHVNLITGNVILGYGGEFRPGDTGPDVFAVQGDCDLSDSGAQGGETKFGLAGTGTAGTNYDQLIVSGQMTLGGTLTLVLLPGYAPQVGDQFRVIQAGSTTGGFTKINTPGFTINTARDASGLTVTITSITPTTAPAITSATTAAGNLGAPFSYRITATNTPAGYVATGLPDGVDVDPSSGLISGVPTEPGVFLVMLRATNAVGTGDATLTLAIGGTVSGAPDIHDQTLAYGAVGGAYHAQLHVYASPSPVNYAASGLPPGLQINASTGEISGTPTQAGFFTVFFAVTNASGTGTRTLPLSIYAVPAITSAATASGTVGVPLRFQVTATNFPTAYYALGLPPGLAINGMSLGLLYGTPQSAGTFTLTLGAANPAGRGSAPLTLTINPAPPPGTPSITSATTAGAMAGVAFTYQIVASNSPTSYGAAGLPAGLALNGATGLIAGMPTTTGVYTVTLSATNVLGTGSLTLTLTVSAIPAITSAADAAAAVNAAFSYQITATNNPTSYSVLGLPAGFTVDPISGLVVGTPTAVGTYTLTLRATNTTGTGTGTLTLTVSATPTDATPTITSAGTATAQAGAAFAYQITATNAPTAYAALGIPAGLTLDAAGGLLSGTPTVGGVYTLTLLASNASGTGRATLTLTVTANVPVVTVATAGDGVAVEGGEKGKVLVRRTGGDMTQPLTVFYKVKGDAVAGVDYKPLTGTVTIPAGASQVKVKIKPLDNPAHDGTRKAKVKLKPGADGSYGLGDTTVAVIRIVDGD